MVWEVRIQYANGNEKVLRTYKNREPAIRYIDEMYSKGYPLHLAYIVYPVPDFPAIQPA